MSDFDESYKTCKKQIEEGEEIAALNLAVFRKPQEELEETEERVRLAETVLQHWALNHQPCLMTQPLNAANN